MPSFSCLSRTGCQPFFALPHHVQPGGGAFLIAYLDGVPFGCGAVRRIDETSAELKRMYVSPQVRGQGKGRAIVPTLERQAKQIGATTVVLQSGTRRRLLA